MPAFEDLEETDFDDDVFDDNVLEGLVDNDNVDDDDDFGIATYDDDFDDDDVDVGQLVDQSASRADDDDDGGGFGGGGGVGNTDTSTVYDDDFRHNKDDDVDQVRLDAFEEEVDASLDVDFQVLLQEFKGDLATPSPTLPPTNIATPLLTNPPEGFQILGPFDRKFVVLVRLPVTSHPYGKLVIFLIISRNRGSVVLLVVRNQSLIRVHPLFISNQSSCIPHKPDGIQQIQSML